MAQLSCRCGERMHTSDDPSPYVVSVYYKEEADKAISNDPSITLNNFMLGWDEKNDCQREYMERAEPVDYWFCPECKRIYEVQNCPHGRWLRIYKPLDDIGKTDFNGWKQLYVITDEDSYAIYEENCDVLLSDYLSMHDSVQFFLSPDETAACAIDKTTTSVLYSYILEESWPPSSDK